MATFLNADVPWPREVHWKFYLQSNFTSIPENMTAKLGNLLNFMIVAYMSSRSKFIIHTRDGNWHMLTYEDLIPRQCDKFHSDPSCNASRYKPPESHDQQVDLPSPVKQPDEILKTAWREDLTLLDDFSAYRDKFINILTQFETMLDGPLWLIKEVLHQTEL